MHKPSALAPCAAFLGFILLLGMILPGTSRAEDAPRPADAAQFTLPDDGPVLRYQRIPGELADPSWAPSLEVFADGRFIVQRPAIMQHSGVWEGQLERQELRSLVDGLVTGGLLEVDRPALETKRKAALEQRASAAKRNGKERELFFVADADLSHLELTVATYKAAGELAGAGTGPVHRAWSWRSLHDDAQRLPEVRELVAFAQAEQHLITLMDRTDLTRLAQAPDSEVER